MNKVSDYVIKEPKRTNEEYILSVVHESKNQLLIPPRLLEANLQTSPPPNSEKMIGIFSSGSTGDPKCIWNRWSNLQLNAKISASFFGIQSTQRIFILASPWHVAGLSWALMSEEAGADWRLEAPYIDKIEDLFKEIENYKPDIILTVPSVVSYLSTNNSITADRLIFGGGTISADMYSSLFNRFGMITQSYGQTEAGGLISAKDLSILPDNPELTISNVGKSPSEIEIEVVDDEIWISSPTSVYESKYFTGDLGSMDEKNELHINGRKSSKSGNCNILTAISEVLHK